MGLLKKLAIYTISNGFTNDALGNVVTKQAANLKKEGKTINYEYDYGRLTAINYPDHPENNVKYHYGGINSSYNRIGRLMLREDGSGAIEYYYGKMGEVLKTVRTLIVPNQAVATYVTQWKYDSHNRLLEMIYPDEEKVTYGYNLGGQVDHVRGYKSYGYDYVNKIGYDKFEQRTYLKYCNGAETFYSYDPARRRLQNLVVNAKAGTIMDNAYSYDAVSNVLGIKNNAPLPQSGKAGGQMSHSYTYDPLYRLASATGTYNGTDNKSASYTLSMGYDNMHRITSKKQHLSQTGVQFDGTLNAGYDLTYTYQKGDGKKFQLDNVRDINYRTEETPTESTNINNGHKYTYDLNGNLVYINTSRVKKDGKEDEKATEQKYKWDEENRLLAADENGFVSNYWYDADGERTVKTSGENEAIYVNSEFSGGNTGTARFSLYVSPYLVAGQGGKYTKHIYIGSQRIVSKLGDLASYGADPRRIPYAGNEADGLTVDYKAKYNRQLQSIKDNYKTFDQPYNGKDNDDYVNGQGFCCNDDTPEAAQARAMNASTRSAVDNNFHDKDNYEKMQFYYHPDHLGSSSYITNLDGEVSQHIEYVPFGEVFIEERNNTWNTPYLFNAKEFDEETGMYYYGARYYEPRLGLWMSCDPMQEKAPIYSTYSYCHNNPILLVDPDGAYPIITITKQKTGRTTWQRIIGYTGQERDVITRVNLYKVTVRDTEDKNFRMEFSVTRDAFTVRKGDRNGNRLVLSNVAYEPKNEEDNRYTAQVIEFPKGNGTKALKLKQHDSEVMYAAPNNVSVEMEYRNKSDVAAGVMMHVGGICNLNGKNHYAASEGCFGIANSDKFSSNAYTNKILDSIINQSQKSKTNKGRIEVIIEKRDVNKIPQIENVEIK